MGYYDGADMFISAFLSTVLIGGFLSLTTFSVGECRGWEKRNDQLVEQRAEAAAAPTVRELLTPEAFQKYKACAEADPCRGTDDSDDRVVCYDGFMRTCLGVKPRAEAP